ncbi:3-oxoacyl-ACP synthase [Nocardia sp. CDC159]|uniref:3-oxoacyl-ACP synthase n=1 Tax=Nocardia pulmonis TaxID=2951408 RepID=A0A9X2EEF4_9NOCA|nr:MULTISPECIES: 3-oxoacyl-[acyl-carrier-protein] synthase III C-terminal domain-containing protein [Nocardia]MCM6778881.1 3-oxoacyl-ACP synthase [Nocardia pulmonis]MCM6791770.1 3-oxoacyl-ACP synthase [Nocardia sp. CDC159]
MSIAAFGSYLPAEVITPTPADAETDFMATSPLFRPPAERHRIAPGERAAEMVEKAARPMFERLGCAPAGNVDMLITNTLLPDECITGCGAESAYRLGCEPDLVLDLHNAGCAAFPYMLKIARAMITTGEAKTVLVANVQNTAGQLFAQPEIGTRQAAALAGDGCGVAYLTADDRSPVLGVHVRSTPAFAQDMSPATGDGRKYWEPGSGELEIAFAQEKSKEIIERGNNLIPEVVGELCKNLEISNIDYLVTNQPNRLFLRNWRNALGLTTDQHLDSFDRCGNLYGAAVPITLDMAIRDGVVGADKLIVMAGFAHAGDFAAAAAVRWNG